MAGGVVGGFASLVLTLAAVWFLLYRKKEANKSMRYEMAQSEAHTAFDRRDAKPPRSPGLAHGGLWKARIASRGRQQGCRKTRIGCGLDVFDTRTILCVLNPTVSVRRFFSCPL